MEYFDITKSGSEFRIEGAPPDAVKAVQIEGRDAKRLVDLSLHKADLEFAIHCLEVINQTHENLWVIRQALWRSAIIHFIKCFGNNRARSQLSAEKIFKGENLGKASFNYFYDLRNKHFIHDENSYAQSIAGALLNKGDKKFKIEKIVYFSVFAETLDQNNYSNLVLLIQKSKIWVETEMETLFMTITNELEKESYEKLCSRKAIKCTVPGINAVSETRNL